jgi:hypothetical protein
VEEILPKAGEIDHVTDVFEAPVTAAVNCFLCPAPIWDIVGVIATETAF